MATQPNTAADHLRSLGDRQRLLEAAGWLLCLIRVLVAACLGSLLGALLFLVIFVFSDQFDGVYLIDGIVGGATWGVIFVCVVGALSPLPWRRFAAAVTYHTVVAVYRCHALLTCLRCSKSFEPEPDGRLLMSVQTNGMGHVVQALRLIAFLKSRGLIVDTICFGELSKVPPAYLAQLRALLPEVIVFDLGHEVDHDERIGASSLLQMLARSICLVASPQGLGVFGRIAALCRERRFSLCISLWDYHVPLYIEASGAPMRLLQIATQGMLYLDSGWADSHFQAQLMYRINLGSRGTLVPLLFSRPSPREVRGRGGRAGSLGCLGGDGSADGHGGTFGGAQVSAPLPIVMTVPPMPPEAEPPASGGSTLVSCAAQRPEGYYLDCLLAYSATPAVLTCLEHIGRRRVLFYTKNVEKWRYIFRKKRNIEIRAVGDDFVALLPRCAGLIASPSPGVVLQALAVGTPCFVLPAAEGHLEQSFNQEYLFAHYRGLDSPQSRPIEQWAEAVKVGDASLLPQARELRGWLEDFEKAADETLLPMVQRMMVPARTAKSAVAAAELV